MEKVLVSIRCFVYNHELYLRQCLDGFVMQKTNFAFEAIVHDDASTDGSAAIIKEYAEKYPDIIKPIYETENQYSKKDGSLARIMDNAIHPDAKYIAMCEGDDYWTDPYKLQKQFDFLENNKEYSFSVHRYKIQKENELYLFPNKSLDISGEETLYIDLDYFFKEDWVTQYLTLMYRREMLDTNYRKNFKYYRDFHIFYNLLSHASGVCLNFVGGVYRQTATGIYAGQDIKQRWLSEYKILLEFYKVEKEKRVIPQLYSYYLALWLNRLVPIIPKNRIEWGMFFIYLPKLVFEKLCFSGK